jgi:DNA polymerase-3 subunit delta'
MDRELMLPRRLPWHDGTWAALQTLKQRSVHAVLLHGARGIGKKSLAFDLAQAALCELPQADGRACGRCTGCVLMEAGSHPDFRFVLPAALASLRPGHAVEAEEDEEVQPEAEEPDKQKRASHEIRVDQVRALADFANVATHRGGGRVILLAPAEALNAVAANALLKLLEEPPDRTLFLLVSDALDELPPTIRSRCVLVQVEAPQSPAAQQWLAGQGVEDPESALAAAGGAPLAALELASGAALEPELRALLLDLLERGDVADPAEIARRIPREVPLAAALAVLQRWCWDLIGCRATGSVRYHPQRQTSLARLARKATGDGLWRWADALVQAQASREHPLNARLVLETLLLQYLNCMTSMH